MADPIAVANKRADAERRLDRAASAASGVFGVTFNRSDTPANRYPDLASMELVNNVAEFIEKITAAQTAKRKDSK
jgi:hypothetical protein